MNTWTTNSLPTDVHWLAWTFERGWNHGVSQSRQGEQQHARGGCFSPWREKNAFCRSHNRLLACSKATMNSGFVAAQTADGNGKLSRPMSQKKPRNESSSLFFLTIFWSVNWQEQHTMNFNLVIIVFNASHLRHTSFRFNFIVLCKQIFSATEQSFPC